ncbi:MAG TPA: ATP-dependent DNA ligase [Roseiflexaceae bacterium]|nr:ATP-dependent DNA ligase [Roseiflexaceae bacterium]
MKAFADLYTALDETNKTNEKVEALTRYFASADSADAAWALYFLIGRRPRAAVTSTQLRAWAVEAAGIPDWLFGECYDAAGDFAETVALLLPDQERTINDQSSQGEIGGVSDARAQPSSFVLHPSSLREWIEDVLLPLRDMDEVRQREAILGAWRRLATRERFVWNKLITGGFRVGVSQRLVVRALAAVSGVDDTAIAHRLMGDWTPSRVFYAALLGQETSDADISRPYPFCLAHPLDAQLSSLGDVAEWQAEWKWDGIRAQAIRRAGRSFIWSRGEELVTEHYPELATMSEHLPDGTVIDGEILPWYDGEVLPFAQLQRRIGRKTLGKKLLAEVPVILMTYDLLEWHGRDIRSEPLAARRSLLEGLARTVGATQPEGSRLMVSPLLAAASWDALAGERERSRELNAEGLMLKRLSSPYRVGRVRGDWWKWKIAPFTADAVLIYAQRGSGKRASLYTDYTFGVWDGEQLVPFAKAYSGLTDAEIRQVDAFVRRNTVEKFGPVRTVKPELVFELAFEAIQRSSRHKSGIAVRFPRILRWRADKPIGEADSLETIRALLPAE